MVVLNKSQAKRAVNYFGLFVQNPIGALVLKDLKEAFDGDLMDDNPFRMASKVGSRDVVMYIEERINEHVYNEDT